MNEFQKTTQTSSSPSANKAPFVITDLILVLATIMILTFSAKPLSASACWGITLLLICGAWITIIPWLLEFRSTSTLSQLDGFKDIEESFKKMNTFSEGINSALVSLSNVQQTAQDSAQRAIAAEERIAAYSKDFEERLSKAANYEKTTLQLEIEKSRRTEKEWITVGIGILDHVLAFASAGIRSGKPEIAEQMKLFRNTCLQIAARAELQPYAPEPNEIFNPERQVLPPNAPAPEPDTRISRVLAPGFLYQGIQVRKAMVLTENVEFTQSPKNQTDTSSSETIPEAMAQTFSTSSFVSVPPVSQQSSDPSFTPAEPLEDEHESATQEPAELDETDSLPEDDLLQDDSDLLMESVSSEPELVSEDDLPPEDLELTAETPEVPLPLSDDSLDDDTALFRQETFESVSSTTPQTESEEEPSQPEAPATPAQTDEEPKAPSSERSEGEEGKLPL